MVAAARSRTFLPKENIQRFIQQLMSYGELIAPKREEDVVALRSISSPDEIEKDFMQTSNNLRTVVEPQNEILLNFTDSLKPSVIERLPPKDRKIVLWCRPCDARALSSLDDNFIDESIPDPYYQRRRESTIIIGLGCNRPFPFCFCGSVGGDPFSTDNLDILTTRMDEGYMFESLSKNGQKLEEYLGEILRDGSSEELSEAAEIQEKANELLPRKAPNPEEIVADLRGLFDAPFWKKWGDKCIGCGICTYLCPTCWCFDMTDIETRGKGYRIRTWDSCQFPLFTLHSSGHNPRPDKASRVRQRVMHKFSFHPTNFKGRVACVGCGRCTELCPMDIDLISILKDIAEAGEQ